MVVRHCGGVATCDRHRFFASLIPNVRSSDGISSIVLSSGCAPQKPVRRCGENRGGNRGNQELFPKLVPVTPDNPASDANRRAWEVLRQWNGKVLTLFSDQDPVTAGGEKPFQKLLPGAQGQPHSTIVGAGHFLQEDRGGELAAKIVAWLGSL